MCVVVFALLKEEMERLGTTWTGIWIKHVRVKIVYGGRPEWIGCREGEG